MGKIGDLIVKLKLDGDEFKKGLNTAKKDTKSFGESGMGAFSKLAAKATAWGAAIAAAAKVGITAFKAIASEGQALQDNWARSVSGMQSVWETFKTKLGTANLSGLIADLKEARKIGRELYDAIDSVGEVTTARNLNLAYNASRIQELRLKVANTGLSREERIGAGEELVKLFNNANKPLEDALRGVAQSMSEKYGKRLGFTDDSKALEGMLYNLMWLGSSQGQMAYGIYNANKKSQGTDRALYLARVALEKEGMTSANARNHTNFLYNYDWHMNDKDREKVEKALVDYYNARAFTLEKTREIQTQINNLKAKEAQQTEEIITVEKTRADVMAEQAKFAEIVAGIRSQSGRALGIGSGTGDAMPDLLSGVGATSSSKGGLAYVGSEQYFADRKKDLDDYIDYLQRMAEAMKGIASDIEDAIVYGISDSINYMMECMVNAEKIDGKKLASAMLSPLADTAIRAGEIIMAQGIAIKAANKALKNPGNAAGAIAAGAALIAAGSAAKAGLSRLASSGAAASESVSGSSSASTTSSSELTIYVKGTISGNDIVLSGQKTLDRWSR